MKCKFTLYMAALLISVGLANAQGRSVSGTVLSADDDEPLVGATVMVAGTNIGVSTNLDGQFTIQNLPASATKLQASYVGMVTREEAIAPNMVIRLSASSNALDEVVVTAYGTAKKSSVTGAISAVKADKMELRPTSNAAAALEGNVTGVQVTGSTGQPGAEPTIRIRGVGTVNGSSEPLWVVDGVPMDASVSDFNPADIESMSVLKDAASCALYGSRAANGVILITTKSGAASKGRTSMNLRINQGWYTRGIKEYKGVNPYQFMEATWQNIRNARMSKDEPDSAEDAAVYASENIIPEFLFLNIFNKSDDALFDANGKLFSDVAMNPLYNGDLDWFDAGTRKGYRQEYVVSGTTSTDRSNTYFSLGWLDEDGYTKDANFTRLTGRVSTNMQVVPWLKVGLNMSGSHQRSSYTNDEDGKLQSIFTVARNMAPIYPVHLHNPFTGEYALDEFGNRQYDGGTYNYIDEYGDPASVFTRNQNRDRHVIWESELSSDRMERNTLQGIGYAEVKFLRDFTFTLKGNLNIRHNKETKYDNSEIGDGMGNNGRLYTYAYRYKSYSAHEQLNWRRTFAGVHFVEVLAAHENYKYNYTYDYGAKTNEVFAGKTYPTNFSDISSLTGYQNNYRTESWLGRVRYGYDDRYNIEGSFRRDGTSRFKKKWGNFGSVGANWVISNEKFMKDIAWISNALVRANWGQVGSDSGSGYYGYMAMYTSTLNAGQEAYYMTQLANPDLKWETAEAWDVAVEARLFNRWNLSVEYFDKRNKDLLFYVQNPMSSGATQATTSSTSIDCSLLQNIGTISNRGVEITTDVDIFTNRDWTVNFQLNATFLKNKVTKLPDQNKDGIIDGTKKIVEGKSRYEYYLRDWAGVDQMTGRSLYAPDLDDYYITMPQTDEEIAAGVEPTVVGNPEGEDLTGETVFINGKPYVTNTSYAGYKFCGTSLPKVYGSFGLNVSWRDLTLTTLFTYGLGGKIYDGIYRSLMTAGATPSNLHADIVNAWNGVPEGMTETSPNRINPNGVPLIDNNLSPDNNAQSSRWLTSADYLVMKNITLHYNLPRPWMKAIGLQGVEVYGTIDNVFTCTSRQGINPTQTMSGSLYNGTVPPRTYSLGLNVKF